MELIKQAEEDIAELKKSDAEVAKFSCMPNEIYFWQVTQFRCPNWARGCATVYVPLLFVMPTTHF